MLGQVVVVLVLVVVVATEWQQLTLPAEQVQKSTCCLGRRQLRASTLQVGQAANNMAISHPQKSCSNISIIHAGEPGNWQKVNRRLTKADKRSRGLAPPLIQAKCIRNVAGEGRGCCWLQVLPVPAQPVPVPALPDPRPPPHCFLRLWPGGFCCFNGFTEFYNLATLDLSGLYHLFPPAADRFLINSLKFTFNFAQCTRALAQFASCLLVSNLIRMCNVRVHARAQSGGQQVVVNCRLTI